MIERLEKLQSKNSLIGNLQDFGFTDNDIFLLLLRLECVKNPKIKSKNSSSFICTYSTDDLDGVRMFIFLRELSKKSDEFFKEMKKRKIFKFKFFNIIY
jgi:hypothetical protein